MASLQYKTEIESDVDWALILIWWTFKLFETLSANAKKQETFVCS